MASLSIKNATKGKNILPGITTATKYNQSGIPTMLVISSKHITMQNRIYLILLIQGVTGGKDQTSGGCSLC